MPVQAFVIEPKPAAHFGVGAIGKLPGIVRGAADIEALLSGHVG
jgi:hypothetical protein